MGTSLGGLCRLSCEADVSSMVRKLQFMLSMVLRARDTTRLVECLLSIRKLWVPPPVPHNMLRGDACL